MFRLLSRNSLIMYNIEQLKNLQRLLVWDQPESQTIDSALTDQVKS